MHNTSPSSNQDRSKTLASEEKASSISHDLPAFGDAKIETVADVAVLLPRLGFDLLFDDEFVDVLDESRYLVMRKEAQSKYRWRPPPEPPKPIRKQWWRHPSGILCKVQASPPASGQCHATVTSFQVSAILLSGYTSEPSHSFQYSLAGEQLLPVCVDACNNQKDLPGVWEKFRRAASAGRLQSWDARRPCQLFSGFLISQSMPGFSRSPHRPLTWDQVFRSVTDYKKEHALRLAGNWKKRVLAAKMTSDEREFWLRAIAERVQWAAAAADSRSDYKTAQEPLPAWIATRAKPVFVQLRKEHLHANASLKLNELLKSVGIDHGQDLSSADRAVACQWLACVTDHRHPKHMLEKLEQANATSLLGLGFHQLLFAVITEPGALKKALWWQSQRTRGELEDVCREPDSTGATLPILWARAWMSVPNRRVELRQFRHREAGARRALQALFDEGLVSEQSLATSAGTIWNEALAPDINLPADEDLVAVQQPLLSSLINFLSEKPINLPRHLVLFDQHVDLMQEGKLAEVIDRATSGAASMPRWIDYGTGQERAALLDRVVSHLLDVHFQSNVAASSPRASRRGPRL